MIIKIEILACIKKQLPIAYENLQKYVPFLPYFCEKV